MRNRASIAFGLLLLGAAAAASDGGPATTPEKMAANVAFVRPAPPLLGPPAGDTFALAILIPALPFGETSNTCVANDDYAPDCAFDGNSTAADLVYLFQPTEDVCVDLTLCGSDYDNVLSVYQGDPGTLVACSDDACGLSARIDALPLTAGNDYYIVVDGWAQQCGGYQFVITNANAALRGTAAYFALAQPRIPDVEVCTQTGAFAPRCAPASDANGTFKVADVNPGAVAIEAAKARNTDDPGAIGGGDVNVLIGALAAALTLTPDEEIAADVDGSGGPPTTADLQQLRRFLVFDFAACAACDTWSFFADSSGTYVPLPGPWGDMDCGTANVALKGIYRGDVDGSWPIRFKTSAGMPGQLSYGTAQWSGDECVVPLHLAPGEVAATSTTFTLLYDATALDWAGAAPGPAAPGFELTVNAASAGTVHGLLAGGMRALSTAGAVVELRFRLRPGQSGGEVSFARLLVNDREAAAMPAVTISPGGQIDVLPRACTVAAIPNPFNPSARVEYTIPAGAGVVPVMLRVVDLGGRVIRELVHGALEPGRYDAVWNGADGQGRAVASGVYLLELQAGHARTTHKAVLVR